MTELPFSLIKETLKYDIHIGSNQAQVNEGGDSTVIDDGSQSSEEKSAKYTARRKCLAACQDQVCQCLHSGFMDLKDYTQFGL